MCRSPFAVLCLSDEHRHLRLQAAGVFDGAVLHRLSHPGGVRHRRPHHPDGESADSPGVAGYHRRGVPLCGGPPERTGGGLLRGPAGDHPGLGGDAAGDRPFTGVPGGAGLWIPAGLLCHRLLLSRPLRPLCPGQGGHGPVCRPRTVQHGPVHRSERGASEAMSCPPRWRTWPQRWGLSGKRGCGGMCNSHPKAGCGGRCCAIASR